MDLKQKGGVLTVKTLAHLPAARFHWHHQLNFLPPKPNEISSLRLPILLLHQRLSRRIWMTHWRVRETNHIFKWRQQNLHRRLRHLPIPPLSMILRQWSLPKNRRWQMNIIIFTTHFQMKNISILSLPHGESQAASLAFWFFWCFCTSSGHEND